MSTVKVRPEDLITVLPVENTKIYIREESGFFQKWRRYLNVLLVGIFVLLPLIRFDGEQAILFDVGQQTFTLFSLVLYPQDLMIFALLFILAAFVLFLVTRHYGRVWCGFTCPQTVWTLGFNWIERRIEGNHNQSRQLDKQSLSTKKVIIKATKHTLWLASSLLTAMVFMSYFYPAEKLYRELLTFSAPTLTTGWTLFFAGCTYINAGWIREKMCLHMCPYSRFQAAMFDPNTSLVTYNNQRGENRGPRKRGEQKAGQGDCIDCKLCVQVCPAGIDIRGGLQYACINCGLCIDACNKIMSKFNYPKNLISFSRAGKDSGRKITNWLYGIAILAIFIGMSAWAATRSDVEIGISRDRTSLYRENNAGHIENTYLISLLNKSREIKRFSISATDFPKARLIAPESIEVSPGEKQIITVTIESHEKLTESLVHFNFKIVDDIQASTITKQSVFINR